MWFCYFLAQELHKSVAEIKQMSSTEFTGWQAYYQALEWMKKAEAETPERAFAFAREVHGIFAERLERAAE